MARIAGVDIPSEKRVEIALVSDRREEREAIRREAVS